MIAPPLILGVPLYGVFVVLAVAAGAAVLRRSAGGDGAGLPALAPIAAGAGLLGGKLFSIVERGGAVWWQPSWELGNGYRYPGALAAALAVFVLLRRRLCPHLSAAALGDALAPSIAAAMCVVRVGCLLAGCCHGVPSSLPWALSFPAHSIPWRAHLARGWIGATAPASLPVHPLQLYFALASALILAALLSLRARAAPGALLPVFLILDGLTKLLLESLRLEYHLGLQIAAAAQLTVGLVMLAREQRVPASVALAGE